MSIEFRSLSPSALQPGGHSFQAEPTDHFVEFYASDDALVASVTRFLKAGLDAGEAAVIVAEPTHRTGIENALRESGIDLAAATAEDRIISLDAGETISNFIIDGVPLSDSFRRHIGSVVERAAGNGRPVRVFGEMVALLWNEGNVAAAVRLEEMWNHLTAIHPFKLFCAYPSQSFDENDLLTLSAVCNQHTHVLLPH